MKIKFVFDDKTYHVFAGISIALLTGFLIYSFSDKGLLTSAAFGVLFGIIIGALKELVYDKMLKKGSATWSDFVATLYGSCVGGVLLIMILGLLLY